MSMEDYLNSYLEEHRLHNLMTRILSGNVWEHSSYPPEVQRQLEANPDLMLEVAKRHLRSFHFFGILDRWNESMGLLAKSFGWKPNEEFGTMKSFHVSSGYDAPTAEQTALITKKNGLDIQLYEYGLQLYEKRLEWARRVDAQQGASGGQSSSGARTAAEPQPSGGQHQAGVTSHINLHAVIGRSLAGWLLIAIFITSFVLAGYLACRRR